MVIRALDIVKQCYSNADGHKVYEVVYDHIQRGEEVTVSFDGVDAVPSSFVNSAFIALLEHFPFQRIRETLYFTKTTPQINEMIKTRFAFEATHRRRGHMGNAYVEYRPKSNQQTHGVTHHVVIVNEKEVKTFSTQLAAEQWACAQGYAVHVARERHRQDRPNPAHWRKVDC